MRCLNSVLLAAIKTSKTPCSVQLAVPPQSSPATGTSPIRFKIRTSVKLSAGMIAIFILCLIGYVFIIVVKSAYDVIADTNTVSPVNSQKVVNSPEPSLTPAATTSPFTLTTEDKQKATDAVLLSIARNMRDRITNVSAARLDEGVAVLAETRPLEGMATHPMAAYWVSNGKIYGANENEISWSKPIPKAPEGINSDSVSAAVTKGVSKTNRAPDQ